MHFICIAFCRRKTGAKLRRARSGEFAARNSMSGEGAGCYSDQVYRGRTSGFQGAEPTGLPPHSTHWCRHGLAEPEPPIKGLAPAICGALGHASVKSGAANQRSLNMSTPSIAKSRNLKTAASKKRNVTSSATARRKVTSAATTAKALPKSDEPKVARVTKQECLLTLLCQAEGASIEEMMQATEWQQHSVCGFLAGTVKKKLGFSLTTSKAAGDVARFAGRPSPGA
jgi:hypothetical protein